MLAILIHDDHFLFICKCFISLLVVAFVLLIILIFIIIYCYRHRRAGYRSAYDTDEAFGHSQLPSADAALRSKANGHPDVKPELYI